MSDDLLATPLNKLPPPVVVSKTDGGGAVSVPNYNDLRDSISIPTADETRYQPQQQQQQYYEQQQQQYYDQQPMTPGPQQYQQQQQQQPQTYYEQETMIPRYAPSIPPTTLKKKRKKVPFFSTDTLKDKKLWVFAVIVFVLYTYGLPKLRAMFPSFVDPVTLSLKTPAVASASLVSGLIYMFVSDFI
jgi:type II secretory pathway pseudopilin PulG